MMLPNAANTPIDGGSFLTGYDIKLSDDMDIGSKGDKITVDKKTAEEFVKRGYAEYVKPLVKTSKKTVANGMEDAVWSYYNQGFSIIPLKERSKIPNIPTWREFNARTPEMDEIKKWLQDGLFQNIGIICGAVSNDLVVIDVDDENIISELGLKIPSIISNGQWVVKTGKGWHIYCRHYTNPGDLVKDAEIHLEYRSNGGYVVAPPSIHPNGYEYYFYNHESPSQLFQLKPKDVFDMYTKMVKAVREKRGIKNTIAYQPIQMENVEAACIQNILKGGLKEGRRNDTAFALTNWYKYHKKLNPTEIKTLLVNWNRRNKVPLPIGELSTVVNSALKSEKPTGCKTLIELGYCPFDDREKCTFFQPEKKTKEKLLEEYGVFEKNDKGEKTGGINCVKLAKLLLSGDNRKYLVTKDNQEILSYNGSFFEPCGDALIKERVQFFLDDDVKGLEHFKNEVVGAIRNHSYVDRDSLNPPEHLVNVRNGVFNIETGELLPHSPEYCFLQEIQIEYVKEAGVKKIKEFFESILNLDDIPIIQEFLGDCLLRSYRFKKALMCVGGTDTGKSQLLSLIGLFLGEKNVSHVPLDKLCYDRFSPVELYGKQANIRAELDIKSLRAIDIFLMLTGGDYIGAERKYQPRFNFRNYAKLIFSCNNIPEVTNKNDAYYNRWIPIEFSNQIPREEQIPNYFSFIATDQELSGLFNYAISGLKRLIENKRYSDYRTVEETKAFMEKGSNPILEFTTSYIERDTEGSISKTELYNYYCDFCKQMGYPVKDSNVFSRQFKPVAPMGLSEGQTQKEKHKRMWYGIKCNWITEVPQEKLKC